MTLTQDILLVFNTSITVIMGVIGFIIVYNAYKRTDKVLLKEFSKRMLLLVTYLTLTVLYWGIYHLALQDFYFAIFPLYFSFMFLFVFVVWALFSFERIMKKYGVSQDEKLEMMEKNEAQ